MGGIITHIELSLSGRQTICQLQLLVTNTVYLVWSGACYRRRAATTTRLAETSWSSKIYLAESDR